jgi:hypothetical protein
VDSKLQTLKPLGLNGDLPFIEETYEKELARLQKIVPAYEKEILVKNSEIAAQKQLLGEILWPKFQHSVGPAEEKRRGTPQN